MAVVLKNSVDGYLSFSLTNRGQYTVTDWLEAKTRYSLKSRTAFLDLVYLRQSKNCFLQVNEKPCSLQTLKSVSTIALASCLDKGHKSLIKDIKLSSANYSNEGKVSGCTTAVFRVLRAWITAFRSNNSRYVSALFHCMFQCKIKAFLRATCPGE